MGNAEMTECFGVMRAAWPTSEMFRQDKTGQAQTISLWAVMAADIPAEIGKATVMELVASRKYPPSIAEFLEAARSKMPKLELEAHEAPTMEEGMKMVAFLERHGGVNAADLPEPYRREYERMIRNES